MNDTLHRSIRDGLPGHRELPRQALTISYQSIPERTGDHHLQRLIIYSLRSDRQIYDLSPYASLHAQRQGRHLGRYKPIAPDGEGRAGKQR